MPADEKHILILGIGNILLSDEGVGVHVVHRLQQLNLPSFVEVIDGGTGGFELIQFAQTMSKVIIIDCLLADADPGTIFRLTVDELSDHSPPPYSPHQCTAIELLRHIAALPNQPEVLVFCVVPKETNAVAMTLSDSVAASIEHVVEAVLKEIDSVTILDRQVSSEAR